MKAHYLFGALTLALGLNTAAQAQLSQKTYSWEYSVGFPMGDFGDFIDATSFRGVAFSYQNPVSDHVSFGFEIGWNVFYQDMGEVSYTEGSATLTGDQFRYVNSYPLLVQGQYHFKPEDTFDFYAGLGIGVIDHVQAVDLGLYRILDEGWQFALRPEAGILFNLKPGTSFRFAAKYYGSFADGDLPSRSFLTLNAGLVFMQF